MSTRPSSLATCKGVEGVPVPVGRFGEETLGELRIKVITGTTNPNISQSLSSDVISVTHYWQPLQPFPTSAQLSPFALLSRQLP